MKALFLKKNCEVSQIRSSTLNCLVVKESLLQTATETLLLHSSLTTNNSWPLLFSKRTINTETHVSGGHVNINFLPVHYPSSGGREGPLFIREIFEYPPRYTPTLNGNQRVHWLWRNMTHWVEVQTWIVSMNLSGTTHLKLESRPASRNFPDSANLEDKKGRFGSQLLHLSFAFMSEFSRNGSKPFHHFQFGNV